MFELIARGSSSDHRWRRPIPDGLEVEVGRATKMWSVPWDAKVSRRHFSAKLRKKKLLVRKLESASNPVFFHGKSQTQFYVKPGEHFVVGDTTFRLSDDRAFVTQDVPDPIRQRTFSHEFLERVKYRDADRRIAVLNRLPGVIEGAGNQQDLMIRLVNLLLTGIKSASTVGVVCRDDSDAIEIFNWDRRRDAEGDFQPSESLIRQAIETRQSVLHVWNQQSNPESQAGTDSLEDTKPRGALKPKSAITADYENDWAFVCPLPGRACRNWGVYVAGKNRIDSGSDPYDLQGDIKFTELISVTLANVLDLKNMERRQASLGQFFAPVVLSAFADRDPEEVLAPRECEVSVLFCDLRGFAARSEEMADDLMGLLGRVSETLGIMTNSVMSHGGVIGDFHGDAAMGFWGWPIEDPAAVLRACNAALDIQEELQRIGSVESSPLRNFQMGIGIATGSAVAGKIGTSDQVKVTVFGPVVNLASRLESMSRHFGTMVLADAPTASALSGSNLINTRRLVRVQPYGLGRDTDVFQVYREGQGPEAGHLQQYEAALHLFENGEWAAALAILQPLVQNDAAAEFLRRTIGRTDGKQPENFDGVVRMATK